MNKAILQRKLVIKIPRRSYDKNSFLFAAMFFLPIINGFLNEIFLSIGIPSISSFVYFFIYLLSFYICFVAIVLNYRKTLGLFIFVVSFILIQITFHSEVFYVLFNFSGGLSSIALSNFFLLFFLGLSMIFIGQCLDSSCQRQLELYCKVFSYIVVALYIITMLLHLKSSSRFNYMTIAYNALPALLIITYCAFVEKKPVAKALFFASTAFIFIGGCRGALLQLSIAIIILFLINDGTAITAKKMFIIIMALFISFIIYINFNQIIIAIGQLLNTIGFKSRIINMFLGTSMEGTVFHFDDRSEIYKLTIPEISFLGKGIFIYVDGVGYPHNIIVEFLLGYGIIFGSILFIGLIILVIRSYRRVKIINDRFLLIIWVSAFTTIFIKMMVSASYLTDRAFWFYLAFMLYIIRFRRT